MMLQQTQVSRVVEKYLAFIDAFPTAADLAQSAFQQVLQYWQGLGYNRRARYLQDAAAFLVHTPKPSYDQLVNLKGVGPYTAAAVCAFAYNQHISAVDVNIERIHRRYFGSADTDTITSTVPAHESRDWHNALMDFGSLVCTKKSPKCLDCPLSESCYGYNHGTIYSEKTRSQKKFEGSVRWHRGQILKFLLLEPEQTETLYLKLSETHRNKDTFDTAISQLLDERFITRDKDRLTIHTE